MQTKISSPLGIVAGGGLFPIEIARRVSQSGRYAVVAGLRGEADAEFISRYPDSFIVSMGQLGRVIRGFKNRGVQEVVFAGWVRHAKFLHNLRLDLRGFLFFSQFFTRRGDDTMLRAIAAEFHKSGLTVVGAHTFVPDWVPDNVGLLMGKTPSKSIENDMALGMAVAADLGRHDIGQAVVVHKGLVVAVEALEGTDALIERSGILLKGGGGVLVKRAKPTQDLRFDLPAIGVETVSKCRLAGIQAVGVEAGKSLLLNPQEIANAAGAAGISVVSLQS